MTKHSKQEIMRNEIMQVLCKSCNFYNASFLFRKCAKKLETLPSIIVCDLITIIVVLFL